MPRSRFPHLSLRLLSAAASLALATACADQTPPATAVLTVGAVTASSIQVRWTAVGDDGAAGPAASQELRSLSGTACPITQANFDTGAPVSGVGAPRAPGASESVTAGGLAGDTNYCFMLKVADEAGNASYSAAVSAATADAVAPAAAVLAATSVGDTSVTVAWTAVGDNGTSGTASAQELRWASGSGCPLSSTNFAQATLASGVPAPAAAGTSQSAAVSGLVSSTDYCFALSVRDEAGNSSLSASLPVTTQDSVAPAAAALSATAATGSSITLGWTAVGDDGSAGTAASYELRYLTGAACPISQASFSGGTAVSGLSAPAASGAAESFTVTGLASDTAHCFMLKVTDDAGNASFSNAASGATSDVTAPDAAAISVSNVAGTTVQIGWIAVGDDGSTGTAAAYDLRYATGGACPLTPATFGGGTAVAGLPAPAAVGTAETATASGLASQTSYCFMLQVADESGNTSYSNSLAATTQDVAAPDAALLGLGVIAATSIQVLWTAVGDDGATGTATGYDLRHRSGASCPITSANFSASTQVGGLAAPRSAGSPESFIVQGLSSDTTYCFMLQVSDEAGNSSFSNALAGTTPDVTPPSAAALSAAVFDTSFRLDWTAVGDDGTTGTAASQEMRYLSGAACPIAAANFATGTLVAGLGAPAAAGTPETITASGLQRQTRYCFALRVADEAGNASVSNAFEATTPDTTAPSPVSDLAASGPDASGAVHLTWTAAGDDGTAGTATSYDVRYQAGNCATFDFATATVVAGLPAPQPSGTAESFDVTLSAANQYCFAMTVSDDIPNTSAVSNRAGAIGDPNARMAQIRADIHAAPSSPISLSADVFGAIVTYVKAAVFGAPVGSADGPGFFVQNGGTGPALFVAMDPAVALPGIAPGDVVDLSITQAAWLGCSAPPCTADNSMYAITQATVVPSAAGATLPAAQDLTNVAVTVPIGAGPWDLEHERVAVDGGTVGAFSVSGAGFQQAQLTTPANASPQFQLRVPDAVIAGTGLISGCRATVLGTPMWRTDGNAQVAAWVPSDLVPAGCPAIALSSSDPLDGSRNVDAGTNYTLTFNQPLIPGTVTAQAASGPCVATNTLQLSADPGFVNCVGISVAASGVNDWYTITPAAPLADNTRYRARLRNPAGSPNGNVVPAAGIATPNGFVTAGTTACTPRAVVISQIYGGGGNTGSLYRNDFIELHNRSAAPVDLTGWSVQYTSAAGTGTWQVTALSGSIAAGGYYLVQEAQGTGGTLPLPTPDATGVIAMASGAGKVALVSDATALTGGCPSAGPTVVDLVGFGATASCFSGTPTATLSNPFSAVREEVGCADTGSDYADFAVLQLTASTPPRSSASLPNTCSCP